MRLLSGEQSMEGQSGARAFDNAAPLSSGDAAAARPPVRPIGAVFDIAGSSSQVMFDLAEIEALSGNSDMALANAGQVGGQVKMRVGSAWLIANIRSLRLESDGERIAAQIDFLGEGDEERLTGKLYKFRRGVTRYPTPG